MGIKIRRGRDRFEMRGSPAWLDMVHQVAKKRGVSIAAFIREGVNALLRREGFTPPDDTVVKSKVW